MLGYSEINIEISDISIETIEFGECRKISVINRVINSMMYNRS